ncbi:MAG: SgcJ/EcaC family oxidoreductase [Chitinophagaceae bacterium]
MRTNKIFLLLVMITTFSCTAQSPADSMAIKIILQEEVTAWKNKDAELYSKHFSNEGTFTNLLGMFFTGHAVFQNKHAEVFKSVFAGTVLQQQLISMKVASEGTIIVETLASVSGFSSNGPPRGTTLDGQGRLNARLLQVMVKDGIDWKIIAYHNTDIKAGIPIPELLHQ